MMTGMLWFDDKPVTVEEKIRQAAACFQKKYGSWPTRAFVDPGVLAEETTVAGLLVTPKKEILRNTIMIGHEDQRLEKGD